MRKPFGVLIALSAAVALAVPLGAVSTAGAGPPTSARDVPKMSKSDAKAALATAKAAFKKKSDRTKRPKSRPDLTLVLRDLSVAVSSLSGADKVAANRILTRPGDGAADEFKDGYTVPEAAPVCSPVVCVHYVVTSVDRATKVQAQRTLATMTNVYRGAVGTMRYRKPLSDNGLGGTPQLDVYLVNVGDGGYYGYCSTDPNPPATLTQAGYCVLDNDFSVAEFGTDPTKTRQITTAHEFFHLVQYAYDFLEDAWFMEGTAVWFEDIMYDDVNDYLQYIPFSNIRDPLTPVDYSLGTSALGAYTYWTYLRESTGDRDIIRQIWERAASGNVYSTPAVVAELTERHIPFSTSLTTYGQWNILGSQTYSEKALLPAPAWWKTVMLTPAKRDTGILGVTLQHFSNAPMLVRLDQTFPYTAQLRIDFNGPPVSTGTAASLQVRRTNGTFAIIRVPLNANGDGGYTIKYPPKTTIAVIAMLTNTSTGMVDCETDEAWTYTCGGTPLNDDSLMQVRARVL